MAVLTRTLVNVPEALAEGGLILAAVICFVALHAILQRRLRSEVLRRHNDVAGYLFSAVGILYAVLLGFVVVVVWQKYDGTVDNVQDEVDAAGDLYHVADALPPAYRLHVRGDVAAYARTVIAVEWPAMAAGRDVPETGAFLLTDAAQRIVGLLPTNAGESNAQQAATSDVQRLFDARRKRLIHAAPAVPAILWFALIAGALAMVAFCYLFGVENRPAQLMMTAILVALIAILFAVVYEFATPFSGSVSISSDGWTTLTNRLAGIQ